LKEFIKLYIPDHIIYAKGSTLTIKGLGKSS